AFLSTTSRVRTLSFNQRLAVNLAALHMESPAAVKLLPADAAATFHPFFQADLYETSGYIIGRATKSGLPVSFDPFDSPIRSNANIGVFAASGQGKSFAVSTIILEAHRHNRTAVIIDPEGEYGGVVEHTGGTYVDLNKSQEGFNIFDASAEP